MPALTGGGGLSTNDATNYMPGVIAIEDDWAVKIGDYLMPFGPRYIQRTEEPFVGEQQLRNKTIIWDYGIKPIRYILEGYPNAAALSEMQKIAAQFNSADGRGVVIAKLIAPALGISDYVRRLLWVATMDQGVAVNDPQYHLELASCGGPMTLTKNGLAVVQR